GRQSIAAHGDAVRASSHASHLTCGAMTRRNCRHDACSVNRTAGFELRVSGWIHMKLLERTPIGRWPLLLGVVVLIMSACEGTVTAPTTQAIQSAIMKYLNQLTVSSCAPDVPQDFFSCSFSGVAQNIGAGCATSLHGVSKSFGPDRSVQLGE